MLACSPVAAPAPKRRLILRCHGAGLEAGDRGVAQDEAIGGTGDGAVAVVLPKRVRMERVLPSVEGALVERRHVRAYTHRHSLLTVAL